ncbi:MAG: hypothetical protein PVJ30_09775 [Thiohalocapsa sp.]
MSCKHHRVAALSLLLIALVLALLLGEGLLRVAGQSYYWAVAKRVDPVLGWRPPPQIRAWQRFEGAALVETNTLGFRDIDHARRKPPGTLRVAVLGDSFTEAVQVPLHETWWRVMAERLNGDICPVTAEFQALNFAVSGWSTAQSLLAWREHAARFAPDFAVLAFFIGNDFTENHPALNAEPLRPYFRLDAGQLALDAGFRRQPAYRRATSTLGRARQWLLEHSRIAQLAVQTRDAMRLRGLAGQAAVGSRPSEPEVPSEPGVDNAVYRPPAHGAWEQSWAVTEAMLGAFAAETRADGATPVLMLIGTGVQVHPEARVSARFAAALGVSDLGYPVRRLLDIAERLDLTVLNLPALLADYAEREGLLLHGFVGGRPGLGHWNPAGHRAAGDAAAALICALAGDARAGRAQTGPLPKTGGAAAARLLPQRSAEP